MYYNSNTLIHSSSAVDDANHSWATEVIVNKISNEPFLIRLSFEVHFIRGEGKNRSDSTPIERRLAAIISSRSLPVELLHLIRGVVAVEQVRAMSSLR